ncbi:Peptide methionine sulfoxide reductase MsrB [Spironucleus salmonicida]|uniref:peptide-methionine (R)-S-oxide reductase n=1 Tax=Spironucleus salmonicida TaxID=348837 RepID=V6LQW7_9EUKA|nr:Peptide methionine sulfoxide reductase MsrB [Spironucleus salmonicida]KAH0576376.1 Peptide methionine sulfoxide reductase MsrB [Spironucleus salmonicida]|eukprot:EST46975.1 Peptide methionine sulfoxide reductase MsrB [Spironucleus salmonicida]
MSLPNHLSQLAIAVTQQAATEPPFSANYDVFKSLPSTGDFLCTVCQASLFPGAAKFDAKCGWPAFWKGDESNLKELVDTSGGRKRTEVRCAQCDAHLGHRFDGEHFGNPKDVRYCINAVSVQYAGPDGQKKIFE